jgi:hypothetical protein
MNTDRLVVLVVFTTFINFVNSFRFDMNKLYFFAIYVFLIIQVRFKFLLCKIEYRYFFNGQLVRKMPCCKTYTVENVPSLILKQSLCFLLISGIIIIFC